MENSTTHFEVPEGMLDAIDRQDLGALLSSINNAQTREAGVFERARAAMLGIKLAPSWTRRLKNEKTPIALIIEKRWLAGLAAAAPFFLMHNKCDLANDYAPLDLCVEARWSDGLSVVADRAGFAEKQAALLAACMRGSVECASILISSGAYADPRRKEGLSEKQKLLSPLMAAVAGGSVECSMFLTSHKACPWTDVYAYMKSGRMQETMTSPFLAAISGDSPAWEIAHHFLDLGIPKTLLGKDKYPVDDRKRLPLMIILNDSKLLESALSFKKNGVDGEALLWRLAEDAPLDYRDANGLGWARYTNKHEECDATMNFRRRLMERWGIAPTGGGGRWSDTCAREPEQLLADSGEPQESNAHEIAESREARPEQTKRSRAVEQCLSAMGAMSAAMEGMAAAMASLSAEMSGTAEPAENGFARHALLESEARGMLERAVATRESLSEIAKKSVERKSAAKP